MPVQNHRGQLSDGGRLREAAVLKLVHANSALQVLGKLQTIGAVAVATNNRLFGSKTVRACDTSKFRMDYRAKDFGTSLELIRYPSDWRVSEATTTKSSPAMANEVLSRSGVSPVLSWLCSEVKPTLRYRHMVQSGAGWDGLGGRAHSSSPFLGVDKGAPWVARIPATGDDIPWTGGQCE